MKILNPRAIVIKGTDKTQVVVEPLVSGIKGTHNSLAPTKGVNLQM